MVVPKSKGHNNLIPNFQTKPNAEAEELVKKIPGVQIESSGNIKAQGEDVKEVLVNGKQYFGDDPTMAMKNIPAEVIDKVQIFDKMSDQAEFTGFDDGSRYKAMNLVTKGIFHSMANFMALRYR